MDYTAFMETLRKKGYTPYFVKTSAEARDLVMNELLKGVKTLGKGGSVTLQETGIWDALLNQDEITLYSTTLAAMRGESKEEALQKAMFADCSICSANALTLQGDIVNIDGVGHRVGALIYGPKKSILVVGRNKICKKYSEAIARIKREACPKNAVRNKHPELPCAQTGKCGNCDLPARMCKITSRMEYALPDREVHIVLVDEDLGF